MQSRALGRTGLNVSALALGTATHAVSRFDAAATRRAFSLAIGRGINCAEIDAADGGAIDALAGALGQGSARDGFHVFCRPRSLVPLDLPAPHLLVDRVYPGSHLRSETERLLRVLRIDRLAVQQLHAWCPEWLHEGDWLETLHRLRDEGKIAAIGISLFDHDADAGLEAVASGKVDCLQVMVNLFDQAAVRRLIPLCARQGVGVIARSPLYFGALTSGFPAAPAFAADDWRDAYFFEEHRREVGARLKQLEGELAPGHASLSDLALHFTLSQPGVATVAVGMHSARHVEANLTIVERKPLDTQKLAQLARHNWLS